MLLMARAFEEKPKSRKVITMAEIPDSEYSTDGFLFFFNPQWPAFLIMPWLVTGWG